MERASYKRIADIGPGGMKCACCAPSPGADKKRMKRIWKRQERMNAMREARNEMDFAQ